jgi:Fe-S-cluster containining protein
MIIKTIEFKGIAIAHDVPESDVPCGSCAVCCEKLSPYLTPEEFASGEYAYTFMRVDGLDVPTITIPKSTQGGCMYYVNNKCSIYNKRPLACRQFDCRDPRTSHPKIPNRFA